MFGNMHVAKLWYSALPANVPVCREEKNPANSTGYMTAVKQSLTIGGVYFLVWLQHSFI